MSVIAHPIGEQHLEGALYCKFYPTCQVEIGVGGY